jgi:hypothetical protein
MALDLNGYIKQSYKRPNRKILESLGANDKLIEYLMETPGNTNWQVVEAIGGSGSEIELPYTFHFELREVEYEGNTYEIPQCTEHDKFIQVIDNFGNGWIPSFEISNYRQSTWNEEEQKYELGEIQDFIPTGFTYGFDYVKDGDQEEHEGSYMLVGTNISEEQLYFIYMQKGVWISESTGDITINKQNGYIIKIISHNEGEYEGQTYIEHEEEGYYLKPGESWTVPGEPSETPIYTDGTNNYFGGEVITPTSDITLTTIHN